MEKEKIIKLADELVKITIEKHNQNLLGQEKMFTFLKKHIKGEITHSDFDNILHHLDLCQVLGHIFLHNC